MNYYFVATALPSLQFDVPPDITFEQFIFLMEENLSSDDLEKINVMRLYFDIQNIRTFLKKEGSFDVRGNFDEIGLEEALLAGEGLPSYVYQYLDERPTLSERLQQFPLLIEQYFRRESEKTNSTFLKEYLSYERKWRLVMSGFRAKQLNRDLVEELQFENVDDDFVAQILAQKDAKTFFPPEEFEDVQPILEEYSNDPLGLYRSLEEYRFEKIDALLEADMFSIDFLLGYFAKLISVENWIQLSREKGLEILKSRFG